MEINAKLTIAGMSCGHCVRHVTEALRSVEGVQVKDVQIGSAEFSYDPAKSSEHAIVSALTAAGYPASK